MTIVENCGTKEHSYTDILTIYLIVLTVMAETMLTCQDEL